MKTKIDMAHDYAMALVLSPDFDDDMSLSAFVKHVWKYADKMQAEEDKRKVGGVPDALLTKDENGNCTHFHTTFGRGECFDCGKSLKEEFHLIGVKRQMMQIGGLRMRLIYVTGIERSLMWHIMIMNG